MRINQKILRKKSVILGVLMISLNLILVFNINLMKDNLDCKCNEDIYKYQSLSIASSSDYDFYKEITIQSSQVNGSKNHLNFPVLIFFTDTDLRDECQIDGDDIAFYSGTTLLDYEIEDYDGSTGELVAWVRIPILSTTIDTIIRMYYGNPILVSSEANPSGVWNEDFVMVNHLNGDSYTELKDSTSKNNDISTVYGTPTCGFTGKINNAVQFDKSEEEGLIIPDSSSLDITGSLTISAWVNSLTIQQYDKIIAKSHTSMNPPYSRYDLSWHSNEKLQMRIAPAVVSGNTTINTLQWHYVTGTVDGLTATIFIDGNYENHIDFTGTIGTNNVPLTIGMAGYNSGYSHFFDGIIDEVRVSKTARSAEWICTEFRNQNNPSSFYNIGSAIPEADITPPTVSISTPSPGSTVSGTVYVNAIASDNRGVDKVEFYIDDVYQHTENLDPYEYDWDTTSYIDGSHEIKAIAYDAAGNTDTDTITVNVNNIGGDITPPTLLITNPSQGSTVSDTILITATASDNVGVTKVEFHIDNVLQYTDTSSPYAYEWDTTTYNNGTHEIKVIAFDAAGNTDIDTIDINVINNGVVSNTLPTSDFPMVVIIILLLIGGFVMMGIVGSLKYSSHTKHLHKPVGIAKSKNYSKSIKQTTRKMNLITIPPEPKKPASTKFNRHKVYAREQKVIVPLQGNQHIRSQQSRNQRSGKTRTRVRKVTIPHSEAKQAIFQKLNVQQLKNQQKKLQPINIQQPRTQQSRTLQTSVQQRNSQQIGNLNKDKLINKLEYMLQNDEDLQEKYKKKLKNILKKNNDYTNGTPKLRNYSQNQLNKMVEILIQNNKELIKKYEKQIS